MYLCVSIVVNIVSSLARDYLSNTQGIIIRRLTTTLHVYAFIPASPVSFPGNTYFSNTSASALAPSCSSVAVSSCTISSGPQM